LRFKTLNSFAVILTGILFLLFWKEPGFWWSFSALLVVYFIILSFGVFNLSLNFFAPAVTSGRSTTIYLTYDDGPSKDFTTNLCELLAQENVPVSFFVIGIRAEENAEIMRQISDGNHFIGNHSYSHAPLFQFWSKKKVASDLAHCFSIIKNYQHHTRKAFRPPIGIMNPNIAGAALSNRTAIIGWNNRTFDTASSDIERIWKRTLRKLEKGKTIVLMHDTQPHVLELTKRIINWGKEKGMKFDTVEHLITELT
jgi:peptidoglycan/xylan/chitin deacetylase (PgdA/CDA1 family)